MKFGIAESTRAKYLLNHRIRKRRFAVDHHGKDTYFFSMAEDLPHHVRAMKVVASTGVPNSFFNNAFVKEYCAHLEPRHRPIYRRTLLRLLSVFVDCQIKEVRDILCFLSQ